MSLFSIFRRKKRANLSSPKLEVVKTTFFQDSIPMIVAAVLMILSATVRGVNLLLAFSSFMVGFLLLDYFSGPRNLRKLVAKRRLPSSIYAGEPFYVEVELESKERRSPSWGVAVQDEWEEEDPLFQNPFEAKDDASTEESKKGDKKRKKKSVADERASDKKDTASSEAETLRPVVYFPQIGVNKTAKAFYAGVMANRGPRRTTSLTLSTRFPLGFFRERSSRRGDGRDSCLSASWTRDGRMARLCWSRMSGGGDDAERRVAGARRNGRDSRLATGRHEPYDRMEGDGETPALADKGICETSDEFRRDYSRFIRAAFRRETRGTL